MQRRLTLQDLEDYIPSKNDTITKHRPDCFYVPRPPARRKYQTAIRSPDRNFFKLMASYDTYLWIVVKKNVLSDKEFYQKIFECFKSVKTLTGYEQLPICETYQECMYWINNFPCQIVLFEDLFVELFQKLNSEQNACGFHVVSPADVDIAKAARHNKKIKNIYDDEVEILKTVKQNMQRLAIKKQVDDKKQDQMSFQSQRAYIRNIIFPNFIKLSKHQKAQHKQYRLNLIGLRKLTEGDKLASKDKFIEYSRQKFPDDEELIQQYNSNSFDISSQILRFYTLDCFFYRILNNTLRIAKSTEEFFSIGEPFNKVFEAIKHEYDKSEKNQNLLVYRGADLTNSQCQYLEENIGRYIEINGFISTSKSFQTAKSFAQDRKSSTIFKIRFKKVVQKYKEFDYGYVDLQMNKCSAYEEDEVLFNALNVFKILGKQKLEGFELYLLEYGSIFQVLQGDPNTLTENDKFAYYSFKELREMNEQVKDIGDVYLKTLEPERAIQIYEFKLDKLKQSMDTGKSQEYEETLIKAADAYLANGQPDKALKYYESTFKTKKKKKLLRRNTFDTEENKKEQATQIITLSTKVASIQTNTDQFQKAEEQYNQTVTEINFKLKDDWEIDIFWKKIDNSQVIIGSKRSQMLFEQEYKLLTQIKTQLQEALNKIKGKPYEAYEKRKIQLKLTEVYVAMAESTVSSETATERIPKIKTQFDDLFSEISSSVEKDSYEQGLINSRRTQILRRTSKSNEQVDLRSLKSNISKVVKHTSETDEQLPQLYKSLSETYKSLKSPDFAGAIDASKKQEKHQTLIYGESDPRPLNTKMRIAMIQREDRNTVEALQQFSEAYHTPVYKTQTKFTIHAKILFNMSQAYTDKGEDGLALKSLQQAYNILEKQLSKKDFGKSVLRFKIRLRMGRIYTSTSLRSEGKIKMAENYLNQYHTFITKFYNYPHTDVAMSYNCLGALYSVTRKFNLAKQNFTFAIEIYSETTGTQSLQVARMKSNLAVCYANLKNISNATKILLESKSIFQKIYKGLRKQNPFQHESMFIQAEIESLDRNYNEAIKSCEQSENLQKDFLQSKKRFQSFAFTKSQFLSPTKNDSFMPKMRDPQQEVKRGIVKQGNEQKLDSIVVFKHKSENYGPMNSLINYMTEHGFKCEFHICECLICLKEYKKALDRLQSLRDMLNDRISKQSINPLFKDTVFSKKKLYLTKSKEYIEKLTKLIDKKSKQQGPVQEQSAKQQILAQQMIDHFT